MTNLYTRYTRSFAAAFAAVVIVGFSGLTLDRGHLGALPEGKVEIGELETISVGMTAIATLPAVEVIGSRVQRYADVVAPLADTRG